MEFQHRFIDTNGIRMHIAEAGQGPLVVLLHGFPESWFTAKFAEKIVVADTARVDTLLVTPI